MADEAGAARVKRGMASILGELETLFGKDDIGAVSIAVVRRDGNVRHLTCFDDGFRIMLIGATGIAHREAIENACRDPDGTNWFLPGVRDG